ncbi:hypothetical protein ACP70R_032476 [Stipagrostis hirtigluma subsp. patula]
MEDRGGVHSSELGPGVPVHTIFAGGLEARINNRQEGLGRRRSPLVHRLDLSSAAPWLRAAAAAGPDDDDPLLRSLRTASAHHRGGLDDDGPRFLGQVGGDVMHHLQMLGEIDDDPVVLVQSPPPGASGRCPPQPRAPKEEAASSPEEILEALEAIPGLARADLLRAYSVLTRDERRFRSLVALPEEMRKDWLLMEMGDK